ncbi:hypothetical protein S83_012749, partial [Arachis hypogaea]
LKYDYVAVNLLKGEQFHPWVKIVVFPEFLLNPVGFVPVLVDNDLVLADSLAIIMYLDDKYPQHLLLPSDIHKRTINFQNYIRKKVGPDGNFLGYKVSLERASQDHTGRYARGDEISWYVVLLVTISNF